MHFRRHFVTLLQKNRTTVLQQATHLPAPTLYAFLHILQKLSAEESTIVSRRPARPIRHINLRQRTAGKEFSSTRPISTECKHHSKDKLPLDTNTTTDNTSSRQTLDKASCTIHYTRRQTTPTSLPDLTTPKLTPQQCYSVSSSVCHCRELQCACPTGLS